MSWPTDQYSLAMCVLREDGSTAAQVPLDVDWEPAVECARFDRVRHGWLPDRAFALECSADPVWHPTRGQPYLEGFRMRVVEDGDFALDFSIDYFEQPMRATTGQLVTQGILQEGELVRCLPVALTAERSQLLDAPRPSFATRSAAPNIPVRRAAVSGLLGSATSSGERSAPTDPALFVPQRVLDEAADLTLAADGAETGGGLVGHLQHDPDLDDVFIQVTGQIPARHTESDRTKLTFTPNTWADVQTVLAERGGDEIMLGSWHSHPVREWCKDCPEEKRRNCPLASGFLSDHDRALQRTVFPRAYSVALVVNDVAVGGPTFAVFGWRRGLLERRGYLTLEASRVDDHPQLLARTTPDGDHADDGSV